MDVRNRLTKRFAVHEIVLCRKHPFELKTGGSASQFTPRSLPVSTNYRESKETDFVVVAENQDGSISEIIATQTGAEQLIREYYAGR